MKRWWPLAPASLALVSASFLLILSAQGGATPESATLKGVPDSAFEEVGYQLFFEPPDKDVAVSKEAAIELAVGWGFGSGVATDAVLGRLVSDGGTKPYDNVVWAVVLDPKTVKGVPPSNPYAHTGLEYELDYFVALIDATTGEMLEAISSSSPVYPTPSLPPLTPPPTPSQSELDSP
jgi:hypothetical protein